MKKTDRIWELDALRGLCILCVILIHLIFDLIYFIGLDLHRPAWYVFIQQYGGVIFVVLSGCCATLGSRSFRRGCIVFACGMLISLVTFGMYRLGMASRDVIVWFGVLHLLGVCMMLYPAGQRLFSAPAAPRLVYARHSSRQDGLRGQKNTPARHVPGKRDRAVLLLVRPPVPVHLPVPPAHCLRPSGTDRGIEKIKSMRPVQPCTGRAFNPAQNTF